MHCADCGNKACYQGKDCPGLAEETLNAYQDPETLKLTRTASALEARYYMKLTRVQELIRFARQMGYRKLGLAFCIGLSEEARLLNELLVKRFEVESVCCKVCGVRKEKLELEKIDDGRFEAMCNPARQAEAMNRAGTDLNVIVGLCLGHDIIFTKHSAAPVTTLVVKDRVLAHNPVGALYSNYWRKRIEMELEDDERA